MSVNDSLVLFFIQLSGQGYLEIKTQSPKALFFSTHSFSNFKMQSMLHLTGSWGALRVYI